MTKAKRHTTTPKFDMLAWAGREIRRLHDRLHYLDEMPRPIGPEAVYRDEERDDITDRIYALRGFLTVVQAKSLAGCLVQLDELFAVADLALSNGSDSERRGEDSRKVRRLVFSMKPFIKSHLPDDTARWIETPDDHLNPWRRYEERVAKVMRRAA